jgi:hypothetical protein
VSAACFARLSALSLPWISLWLGVHINIVLWLSSFMAVILLMNVLKYVWAGPFFCEVILVMQLLLSVQNVIVELVYVLAGFVSSWRALLDAYASASASISKTDCFLPPGRAFSKSVCLFFFMDIPAPVLFFLILELSVYIIILLGFDSWSLIVCVIVVI